MFTKNKVQPPSWGSLFVAPLSRNSWHHPWLEFWGSMVSSGHPQVQSSYLFLLHFSSTFNKILWANYIKVGVFSLLQDTHISISSSYVHVSSIKWVLVCNSKVKLKIMIFFWRTSNIRLYLHFIIFERALKFWFYGLTR